MDIDDSEFTLGIPTPVEMLEQHILLLQAEYETTIEALAKAKKDIATLVEMYEAAERDRAYTRAALAKERLLLTDFRAENERLEARLEERERQLRRVSGTRRYR